MAKLISDNYRNLMTTLHEERPDYGVASWKKWLPMINDIAKSVGARKILDYGCGKGGLSVALPLVEVTNYDPAIEKWSATPEPHDFVVCTDVLEHIEPDCLDAVLDDLVRVTDKVLFASIATTPAVKTLADGRNAHLIVEPMEWWLPKLWDRFMITMVNRPGENHFVVVMSPKKEEAR